MASNPYVNKVDLANGTTLIDLTADTATQADVAQGKYFHLPTGERVQGTASGGGGTGGVTQDQDGYIVLDDQPGGGGGGNPVVASGTFTGGGTYQISVALGTKVPIKNFAFIAEIDTDTIAEDTNYKIAHYTYVYDGIGGFVKQGYYYYPVTGKTYTVGETTKTLLGFSGEATFMRNTNNFDGYRVPVTGTDHQYRKGTDTINFRIDTGNGNYKFVSGETYNWKLIYFGSNYDNESITYSEF